MSTSGETVTQQMCETFYCPVLEQQLSGRMHEGLGQSLSTRWGKES